MNMIDKLKLDDIIKKNTIILTAFGISLIAGLSVSILNKDYSKSIFYAIEIVTLTVFYIVIKFLLKKHTIFPFVMVIVAYGFMIISILTSGGTFISVALLFFLLLISTAHLILPVFIIGYIVGFISIYLNTTFAIGEQQQILQESLMTIFVAYALAGVVAMVIIHLSKKQFNHIEDLFLNSEKETEQKVQEQLRLEQSVE